MALAATSFVDQETTFSAIIPVIRTATRLVWKAGWGQNAAKLFAVRVVVPSMVLARFQENAGVSTDGKASTVISAFRTQDVSMALALNHGNASVKPTGVVSSVIKILTTVGLTRLV